MNCDWQKFRNLQGQLQYGYENRVQLKKKVSLSILNEKIISNFPQTEQRWDQWVGAGFIGLTGWPHDLSKKKEKKKQEIIMHFLVVECREIDYKILQNSTPRDGYKSWSRPRRRVK